MRYIRGNFVGTGTTFDSFRAPDNWRHVVDLRREDGSGGGVFVAADATPVPPGAVELQQGGLTGPALDSLWAELTVAADPLGVNAPRSIMPGHAGRMTLWLPEREVARSLDVVPGDPEWASILSLIRLGYLEKRAEAKAGLALLPVFDTNGKQTGVVIDREFHRRYLEALVEKYGLDYRTFQLRDSDIERAVLGPTLPDETPLPHSTQLLETFNKADSTILGPVQTWTELTTLNAEVISNEVVSRTSSGTTQARAEADLSTSDHFAEVVITQLLSGAADDLGTLTRFQPSASTGYQCFMRNGGASAEIQQRKWVNGSFTTFKIETWTIDSPETLIVEIDGSSLRTLIDGTEEIAPTTTTAIPSGTRCGLYIGAFSGAGDSRGDDWRAKDGAYDGGFEGDTSDIEALAATQQPTVMAPIPAQVVGY